MLESALAISAIGGAISDAVVCGEGEDGVGVLLFVNRPFAERLGSTDNLREAVRAGRQRLNAQARGSGGRVARALILDDQPDPASGEITDKGYINQALARERRAADVARLFAADPDPDILSF